MLEVKYDSYNSEITEYWMCRLHKYIKDYELKKWGHSHMVRASLGRPFGTFVDPMTMEINMSKTKTVPLGGKLFGSEYKEVEQAQSVFYRYSLRTSTRTCWF